MKEANNRGTINSWSKIHGCCWSNKSSYMSSKDIQRYGRQMKWTYYNQLWQ